MQIIFEAVNGPRARSARELGAARMQGLAPARVDGAGAMRTLQLPCDPVERRLSALDAQKDIPFSTDATPAR